MNDSSYNEIARELAEYGVRIRKMIDAKEVLGKCVNCNQAVIARTQDEIQAWELMNLCARCADEGLMTCER